MVNHVPSGRLPITDTRKVIELDRLSDREFDRTKYANDWIMKQGTETQAFGKSLKGSASQVRKYRKTLEDYVAMKNAEHQERRRKLRVRHQTPESLMVYEIRD